MSVLSTCCWVCCANSDGVAAQVLMNLGLKLDDVREEVLNLLGAGVDAEETNGMTPPGEIAKKGKSKTPALDSFGRDLTDLAREGKLDPCHRAGIRDRACDYRSSAAG